MFDLKLFFLLTVICLPGIMFVIPRMMRSMGGIIEKNLKAGQKMPSHAILIVASSLQALLFVALAAAVGVSTREITGLSAPLLSAVLQDTQVMEFIEEQLLSGFIGGLICSALFIPLYYFIFRPRLDTKTLMITENLRKNMGLLGRIFYGGIYEEVLIRWGLMSLFVWLASLCTGAVAAMEIWLAIVTSGLLFAYGHLPTVYMAGATKTPTLIIATLVLNGWASLVFGWLFWKIGLTSAIFAHMLLHCIWHPLECHYSNVKK